MNALARISFVILAMQSSAQAAAASSDHAIPPLALLPGEQWWGGWSVDGSAMPYDAQTRLTRDLYGDCGGNQAQPLLLSQFGRYVWSEQPFRFDFAGGVLRVTATHGKLEVGQAGASLREGFTHVARHFFPADGRAPDSVMFSRPQYNTWIELMYDQNQRDILRYARAIVDHGFPSGVLMIDDNWQENYGNWEFSARRFSDPKVMMSELHALGFKVMLWVCPFVSPDSEIFRELESQGLLLKESQGGRAAIVRWWNGVSACLDLTHPGARAWFKAQLDRLTDVYGVDGFKFDAGDSDFYRETASYAPGLPNDQTELFGQIGLGYPLNEYRASWKTAGRPLVQRLRDKAHRWDDLGALIPGTIAQGLMGYAFTCPDLIGGGEFRSFLGGAKIDEELVVRSAQVHALMPMMQFSAAPWRVLSSEHSELCRRMAELHTQQADVILTLARHAAETGEPIIRPLCWQWPGAGYERIADQFMLGDDIMVAPVVKNDARQRSITFPPGTWRGDDDSLTVGPAVCEAAVPLDRLPWFRRIAN